MPLSANGLTESWSLKSKLMVVTGGTKGIGFATVQSLLAHGAEGVLICARGDFNISDIQSQFPDSRVYGVQCDISTKEGRSKLVAEAEKAFGDKLHGLINNVGVNVRKEIIEQTEEEYHQIMKTNIDATYFLCKEFKSMLENAASADGGSAVVNVASAAGVGSTGTGAAYGMSKAAMIHLTKILACEWAKLNIRVNAIAPWMTMTPMLEEAVKGDPSQLDKVKEWTPMHRLATVEDIAGPITYLCMPSSRYITGQVISVDGGLSAQSFDGPCATPS
uniref:Uncharacterized protein n=1 Tax=Odontella aurita TaxID=265563 RepID=A0A7S4HU24_9STRA|mmetsp:Transcript_15069/g.43771  ORF Transcript_15069/g.43771 Transcript_15069/m.43771 type:complete len:276 (+) Transcript_15069:272-1099(+)